MARRAATAMPASSASAVLSRPGSRTQRDTNPWTSRAVSVHRLPSIVHRLPSALVSHYSVKEIFFTLQGEGVHAGRPAVFCRFAGCNLWTGREEDRAIATCKFCDTDFFGIGPDGGRFVTAAELADAVASRWPMTDE